VFLLKRVSALSPGFYNQLLFNMINQLKVQSKL
jgi:hypothetical protein